MQHFDSPVVLLFSLLITDLFNFNYTGIFQSYKNWEWHPDGDNDEPRTFELSVHSINILTKHEHFVIPDFKNRNYPCNSL